MDLLKYNKHWQKDFLYNYPKHRFDFKKIISLLYLRQIISITGIRRIGKSVILLQVINHLIEKSTDRFNILYFTFDFEKPTIEELLLQYQKQTGKDIKNTNEKFFIFLDEIQKLPNFQEQLKLFYDLFPNIKFIISGSTSLFIKRKTQESLAGRIFNVQLKPLNFKEYLFFSDKTEYLEKPLLFQKEIEIEFFNFQKKQFIETISMTEEQTIWYVNTIIDKIIYEDIPQIYSVSNPQILKRILNLLAQSPGMLINYSNLSRELGISNKTVSLYFEILENAFLIKIFKNFSLNLSTSDRKSKKAYLTSVSFAVLLNNYISEGLAAENYVATQSSALFYWRDSYNHEIDFVLIDKNQNIIAQEVKYKNNLRNEDLRNIIIFAQKFNTSNLQIIGKTFEIQQTEYKGFKIEVKPIFLF